MPQVEKKQAMKNEILTFEEEMKKRNMVVPKNFSDTIYNTLTLHQEKGRLSFPKNYDLGNALTSAYLTIMQDDKLQLCDNQSIIQSMMDMATMGLNPSKKQCYFIPYGKKCTLSVSYHGKMATVKRIKGVLDIRADVIYKDTEYELFVDDYGNDDIKIIKPCPLSLRKQENIEGAWCRIIMDKNLMGTDSYVTIMTIEDIKRAHSMGSSNGKSKAHNLFLNEMAKKSVINRCIKNYINTTSDDDLIIDSLNRTIENDYSHEEEQSKIYEKRVVNVNEVFDKKDDKKSENIEKVYEVEKEDKEESDTLPLNEDNIQSQTSFDDFEDIAF